MIDKSKRKYCEIMYNEDGTYTHQEYELGMDYWYNDCGRLKEQLDPIMVDGKVLSTSGWAIYNTMWGHCGLCGSLTCARNGQTCQGGS